MNALISVDKGMIMMYMVERCMGCDPVTGALQEMSEMLYESV